MQAWCAVFEEDPYSRGFIYLQRGGDEATRELFDFIPSELIEDTSFQQRLGQLMAVAKDEAAWRNANDERAAIEANWDSIKQVSPR